ncbi:DUF1272 domain-containing protein [Kordiimonas sp. SCSIO 12603]|uniref:DUF1272 domain-containing protein n=1 Tax=Kordiimonas sp. SCSIO 12603 TaxID=2829596 RepID=UPI0022028050|nr:DUF1272 domain-containing protein [Kordiimonas sp. SCSIO 12603]
MLEMRPNCENCDCDLPSNSREAMICSYECTFCRDCVEDVLENVCPNCGGGFFHRPSRVQTEHCSGVSLQHQPVSRKRVLKPVDKTSHAVFAQEIKNIPPEQR